MASSFSSWKHGNIFNCILICVLCLVTIFGHVATEDCGKVQCKPVIQYCYNISGIQECRNCSIPCETQKSESGNDCETYCSEYKNMYLDTTTISSPNATTPSPTEADDPHVILAIIIPITVLIFGAVIIITTVCLCRRKNAALNKEAEKSGTQQERRKSNKDDAEMGLTSEMKGNKSGDTENNTVNGQPSPAQEKMPLTSPEEDSNPKI